MNHRSLLSAILSFPKGYNEETFVLLFLSEIIACHVSVNFLSTLGTILCHARHFQHLQANRKVLTLSPLIMLQENIITICAALLHETQ